MPRIRDNATNKPMVKGENNLGYGPFICTHMNIYKYCYDAINEDIIALVQAYILKHITGMKEGRMVI